MGKVEVPRDAWPAFMARAQAGDRQAYTQLLQTLVPVIRAIVRKQVDDEVLTEDVIQDVLLTLHRIRHTYDPASPFLPWLMAISQARAIDALRRRGRRDRREVVEDEATLNVPDNALALKAEMLDVGEELDGFLNQLPARQRQLVEDVHLQEMSLAEAAQANNLTVGAVKSLLHRALNNLRRYGAHHGQS
ncbi:RNA polymerase sigma factor [Scandinavium manionii]|uniref:RNA polymerase sigma factor n=1 Tax=Scandinavium manionii TaxID=2926520 RepID=UPI00135787E8|nr:sigma-70 family RNA polymerase sigma factor [Scandinavium manionii]MCS2147319.1 sigma-70 family RNA polymerase sigma factor [Scandinavium manionii]MCS2164765.1 sigma-70 family RNA polymerase sigma factor [Scandinavium manionii]